MSELKPEVARLRGSPPDAASDLGLLSATPVDPRERLREIAIAIVPDRSWCEDPDNAVLLDLVVELGITDASQIAELLPSAASWKDSLAAALASPSWPGLVGERRADEPQSASMSTGPEPPVGDTEDAWSRRWADGGFLRPETAQLWAGTGLDPVDARAWYDLDVRGPGEALRWSDAGFTPSSAREWIDLLDDPTVAAGCAAVGLAPSEVAALDRTDVAALVGSMVEKGIVWFELRPYLARGIEPAVAFDWIERRRVNPVRVEWAYEWAAHGFSLSDAVRWHAAGFPQPDDANGWRSKGFDAGDAVAWVAAGVPTASVAADLRSCINRPAAFMAWKEMGISEPALIAGLLEAGVGWSRARGLIARHVGHSDLLALARSGPPTAGLEKFIDCGRTVDEFHLWRRAGFDVAGALDWIEHGFESPESARRWLKTVTDPQTARRWSDENFDAKASAAWISHGFSPRQARAWMASGRSAEERTQWLEQGIKFKEALEWCAAGITSPTVAARQRTTTDLATWRRLADLGLTRSEIEQIASSSASSSDVTLLVRRATHAGIERFRESGAPPLEWAAWLRVFRSVGIACDWIAGRVDLVDLETAVDEYGLVPRDLRRWTSAGVEPRKVLDAHAAGFRDPGGWRQGVNPRKASARPPRVVPDSAGDSFLEWIKAGEEWLAAVGADIERYDGFLRMIHEEGLEWAEPDEDVLGVEVSEEWLEEIYERLLHVSDILQKEPRWPKVFESSDVRIVLDGRGDYPLAWVGGGESGGLVCFHHERGEVCTAATNPSWRYMAGVAISWFIDCCIVLRFDRRRRPFAAATGSASGTGLDRAGIRYSPRPSFFSQYETARTGGGSSPRAHLVDGFVRTYQLGQQPTEEARRRAPARIRRRLQPNQTWVSPHLRGGQYAAELLTYLSQHSALADAMAFADQDSNA